MKILHTADWHIGSFKGPELNGVNLRSVDTMNCLKELVRVAKEEQPDLVLVSGDIFHQAEVWQGRSHREVLMARQIILELSNAAKEVIVMRGTPNHDSEEAFAELEAHFEFIHNVHIFTRPARYEADGADIVVIPGFDKGTFRAQFPGISKEDENVVFTEELGKIVTGMRAMCREGVPVILMSHYTVPGCNAESGQTQFLTQFEPVISQEMLMAANYDLVALGHIHRPQAIQGLENVYYSGAINAMNFNDEGQERGFWIHEDLPFGWRSEFYKTPYREFKTIVLENEDIELINGGDYDLVANNHWRGEIDGKIVRVRYNCTADNNRVLNKVRLQAELIDDGAFWVSGIEAEKIEVANRTELSKQEDPETNLVQYLTEKLLAPERIDEIVEKARPIIAKAKANSSMSEFFGTFVPKEIEVKNYRNYVEQRFSFEDISFCTINGTNGAGKSSLFMDAIIDCLYEEPREGTNTGWIRNDEKARSGSISFTFALGDKTFRVVRTRTKSGKPTLNFSEQVDGNWIDRSAEKIVDTQKEIVKVLGMDSLTFKACVLIMQDQYGLFLEANKEERVGVLSNLLGLGIYGIMETLAKAELSDVRREIEKNKQTVNVHLGTIEKYGTPEEEYKLYEDKLAVATSKLSDLQKSKEDKNLILGMQKEAEERRNKVLASVNTLEQKKAATEQNIKLHEATISNCDYALSEETMIAEKVERYNQLVESEKELASAKATYLAKKEEFERVNNEEIAERQKLNSLIVELQTKELEIRNLSSFGNEEEIRQKAFEYEMAKKELDEAYQKETQYRAVERELSLATAEKNSVIASYEAVKKGMESKLEAYKKQAELLDTVECVDIANAKCGFLSNAIKAKNMIEQFPTFAEEKEKEHQAELNPHLDKIEALQQELAAFSHDKDLVTRLMEKCQILKPYVAKLQELNERESRIALMRASVDGIQSNISELEKRFTESNIKATELKAQVDSLGISITKLKHIEAEMEMLKMYVEKANNLPVIRERKSNAENAKSDEIMRLFEIEKELDQARAELEATSGATEDLNKIIMEINVINSEIADWQRTSADWQRMLGSLKQKIEEMDKLKSEIAEIEKHGKELAKDYSTYEMLKVAFSQDGIPHQIIRSLVPKLTEISSSILGQMTGGAMGIEFATEKVMKSNSNKEVVTLDIFIEEYGKSTLPYLSKSGGEKVKAALSVILALAEIKSTTAGIQLGMLFIDEPPFLDADGVQAYCDALETIQSRYPHLKIMAITHDNSMKARFPQSLDVVKTSEGSKVIY